MCSLLFQAPQVKAHDIIVFKEPVCLVLSARCFCIDAKLIFRSASSHFVLYNCMHAKQMR